MVRNADQGIQCVAVIPGGQQVVARTLPSLERRLDDAIATKPSTIDFSLSAVQVVDSAALNWLLTVLARLEPMGIQMRLMDSSTIMADALLATRLDSRFTIENSPVAAIEPGGANGG